MNGSETERKIQINQEFFKKENSLKKMKKETMFVPYSVKSRVHFVFDSKKISENKDSTSIFNRTIIFKSFRY